MAHEMLAAAVKKGGRIGSPASKKIFTISRENEDICTGAANRKYWRMRATRDATAGVDILVPLFLEWSQLPEEEMKPLDAAERTLRPRATTSGFVRPSGKVEP